jgi:hypothetical protein
MNTIPTKRLSRYTPAAVGFLMILTVALFPRPSVGQTEAAPGFTALFNGKNLDGWRTAKTEKAEPLDGKAEAGNGRIKVASGVLSYDPKIKGNCYIDSTKEFSKDVHIKLEFKPGAGCNNDFFLRGSKFDIVPGKKETQNVKEGEWQMLELIVKGDEIVHKIDGAIVRTAKTSGGATPFMLRAESGSIELRNIQFKE